MIRRASLTPLVSLVVALALLGAGCSGNGADDAADVNQPATPGDGGDDEGGAVVGDTTRCPLTAEQVGEVLGATVERDGDACTFYPPEAFSPRALFIPLRGACEDLRMSDPRLESFQGLGVEAYAYSAPGVPSRILVCGDAPFDISAEIPDEEERSVTAVEELARLALEGE
jgi:hypothetical protein